MSDEVTLSGDSQKIMDMVKVLPVMDLANLVKAMEKEFGVSAAAPMMMAAGGAAAGAPAEAKTAFSVELKSAGGSKINVIKVVREITALGLKEAKDLVDGAPKMVKEGVKMPEAEEIKKKLEEAGATVEIK